MAVKKILSPVFTKERLLQSKRFAQQKDLLNALLKDDQEYTIVQVETILNRFLKGKVN